MVGPHGFTAPSVEFDARVGKAYRIAMQPPDGDLFHLSGEFRDVEPPARLAYTFNWTPAHPDDRETAVTLLLEDRGEETVIRLTQGEFATRERYELHRAGMDGELRPAGAGAGEDSERASPHDRDRRLVPADVLVWSDYI